MSTEPTLIPTEKQGAGCLKWGAIAVAAFAGFIILVNAFGPDRGTPAGFTTTLPGCTFQPFTAAEASYLNDVNQAMGLGVQVTTRGVNGGSGLVTWCEADADMVTTGWEALLLADNLCAELAAAADYVGLSLSDPTGRQMALAGLNETEEAIAVAALTYIC